MNKALASFVIYALCFIYTIEYESSYYKNFTNILDKNPKVDIDYIFTNPEIMKNQKDNPSKNFFQNIFYDYYQTSVPLYNEKMKCYFPIKKNISLNLNSENENITKIKNISKYYGKTYLRPLKGICDQFYIERWYYMLCPLVGAKQTLSYIKQNDKQEEEKQEVNYLGYETTAYNNSDFLDELPKEYKLYVEKKFHNEFTDIEEENLFNIYGIKNKIIGIYKKIVRFYGENVFDAKKYENYSKTFVLEYTKYKSNEIKVFKSKILKVINNNMILIERTLDRVELLRISKIKRIKILKNEKTDESSPFFNQSFIMYDEYLYSSKLNLAVCLNMNCHVTISGIPKLFKLDTVVETNLALIDKSVSKLKINKNDSYCIFLGDDLLYYFGNGEIEELTETTEPSIFTIYGDNLHFEKYDKILVLFSEKIVEYSNYVFMNDILKTKYIEITYLNKINQTHHKVKMVHEKDISYFDKQIILDGRYIIVKNNTKKKNETKKEDAQYVILGNEKNISLDQQAKEIGEQLKIVEPSEKFTPYKLENNKEFEFNFELAPYNYDLKDSYVTICFSNNKKCKEGEDYEMIIDLKNDAVIVRKFNDSKNNNESIVYYVGKLKNNSNKIKLGIIFLNSTIYFNSVFKEEKKNNESEIKLKYQIKNETYVINYIIINQNKSSNIYIQNMLFEDNISFDNFKNIYIYNQKFLLDDNAIFIDTYETGDYCQPIKAHRRVIAYYSCDEEGKYDLKLTNVFEDKKQICVYHFYAKSKYLCNPNLLMKNYVKSSGLKTYCYLDN